MLHFLRHIRQKLILQENIRKYLLYAVGEILLVVIGILIALQVNNWNEANKNKIIEKQILQQLVQDLNGALNDIDNNTSMLEQSVRSADILLTHMDGEDVYNDSIGNHISNVFTWTRLVINTGGYESMKSEGIDIISNDDLRNQIINLFEGRLSFHRDFERMLGDRSEYLLNIGGSAYFRSMNEGFGFTDSGFTHGITEPLDYEELRKDSEFRFHIRTMRSQTKGFLQIASQGNRRRIVALMNNIQKELEDM